MNEQAEQFDVCIIGAGVVGLALARQLTLLFPDQQVVVLEQSTVPGSATSSRNSEVIHAGLYYQPGSLKATTCLRGRDLLYDYCNTFQIPYLRCGKLIVGNQQEAVRLEAINKNSEACSGQVLEYLEQTTLRRLEPELRADLALFSPNTGIIDSHAFMQSLSTQAQSRGALIVCNTRFIGAEESLVPGSSRMLMCQFQQLQRGTAQPTDHWLSCRVLINCAGLQAAEVARRIAFEDCYKNLPPVTYIKGNYFSYSGKAPFRHLVYPVPDQQHRGLGIHATLDLQGRCRFGPDIEELNQQHFDTASPDYSVSELRRQKFLEHIQAYFPAVDSLRLQPDYSGIRTRCITAGGYPDFKFAQQLSGECAVLSWLGIESPGLTASLALAEMTAESIRDLQILNGGRC
jgi:L-2-hydroxyglutarate oxidase LhgO